MKYSVSIAKDWPDHETTFCSFERSTLAAAFHTYRQEKKLLDKLKSVHPVKGFVAIRKGDKILESILF
jgi:hypothetical protein